MRVEIVWNKITQSIPTCYNTGTMSKLKAGVGGVELAWMWGMGVQEKTISLFSSSVLANKNMAKDDTRPGNVGK